MAGWRQRKRDWQDRGRVFGSWSDDDQQHSAGYVGETRKPEALAESVEDEDEDEGEGRRRGSRTRIEDEYSYKNKEGWKRTKRREGTKKVWHRCAGRATVVIINLALDEIWCGAVLKLGDGAPTTYHSPTVAAPTVLNRTMEMRRRLGITLHQAGEWRRHMAWALSWFCCQSPTRRPVASYDSGVVRWTASMNDLDAGRPVLPGTRYVPLSPVPPCTSHLPACPHALAHCTCPLAHLPTTTTTPASGPSWRHPSSSSHLTSKPAPPSNHRAHVPVLSTARYLLPVASPGAS